MVQLARVTALLACLVSATDALHVPHRCRSGFPGLPFNTDGPKIVDSSGIAVKYAGTNWPGHGTVMLPEGLQYQSIETIVSGIKSLGMNAIRLTYAIQMIDEIYDNGQVDVDLQTTFVQGLGQENGTSVLKAFLGKNPQFTASSKRLEVFDAVAAECARQQIYIHLDNHISKAEWCCSLTDGNGWWGDTYFNADNWVRGLSYMANHGKSWSNLASMSLRNELRQPSNNAAASATYNWETWYSYIQKGSEAIHSTNGDVLIFLSGLNYDTDMQAVVRGAALTPGSETFSFNDFPGYANKLVVELHNYQNSATSCADLQGSIYNAGAQAMNPDESTTVNVFPVLLTEFGFLQDGNTYKSVYSSCLAEWLPQNTDGWMDWALGGSYYSREGIQDFDETWGLYNHDWSAWRDPAYVNNQLIPMVAATLG